MPRKKKVIPEYGTCIRKGIEYHRRSFQHREQGHLGGQDEAADA